MNVDTKRGNRGGSNYVARVMKALSTFTLVLAEVSMNGILNSAASSLPFSVSTTFTKKKCFSIKCHITRAGRVRERLTLLSFMSHLFPIKILLTPSLACCSMLRIQVLMAAKKGGDEHQEKWERGVKERNYHRKTSGQSHRTRGGCPWHHGSRRW